MIIRLAKWGTNLGTRDLGELVRREMVKSLEFFNSPIEVSFKDVFMVSSSFADECFGKLIVGIGAEQFKRCFVITDLNDERIRMILNRSVKQRISQSV